MATIVPKLGAFAGECSREVITEPKEELDLASSGLDSGSPIIQQGKEMPKTTAIERRSHAVSPFLPLLVHLGFILLAFTILGRFVLVLLPVLVVCSNCFSTVKKRKIKDTDYIKGSEEATYEDYEPCEVPCETMEAMGTIGYRLSNEEWDTPGRNYGMSPLNTDMINLNADRRPRPSPLFAGAHGGGRNRTPYDQIDRSMALPLHGSSADVRRNRPEHHQTTGGEAHQAEMGNGITTSTTEVPLPILLNGETRKQKSMVQTGNITPEVPLPLHPNGQPSKQQVNPDNIKVAKMRGCFCSFRR